MEWRIQNTKNIQSADDVVPILLANRGIVGKKQDIFLNPPSPEALNEKDVHIDKRQLQKAIACIQKAINNGESVVVYTDYDADGITGGAILWETLYTLDARVMPYIPDREEEGYGLSKKGIDTCIKQFDPQLIITVDHGITARDHVRYITSNGIDCIITDHHTLPKNPPDTTTVHTTTLAGSGVAWFLSREIKKNIPKSKFHIQNSDHVALAAIGTIADLVPLVGPNRSIAKYGLSALAKTQRVGLLALIQDAGIDLQGLEPYHISHILAPRINAMGRLEHALDALRLLCTKKDDRALVLARRLGLTNKRRQDMTVSASDHARGSVEEYRKKGIRKKLLFISDERYNPGIIGLVASRLVEEYYRPSIVISRGAEVSKASARSIAGFNIIDAIRKVEDLLVDAGGHPMAAGFTVKTKNLSIVQERLEAVVEELLEEKLLERVLPVDCRLPLSLMNEGLWHHLQALQPFGVGNPRPVFETRELVIRDIRPVGRDNAHLKLIVADNSAAMDAIGFRLGRKRAILNRGDRVNIAYTIDKNVWNGSTTMQLKIKDIIGVS